MLATVFLLIAGAELPAELASALHAPVDNVMPAYRTRYQTSEVTIEADIDTAKPVGERISVISPPRDTWSEELEQEILAYETAADGDIWCDSSDEDVGTDFKVIEQSENSIKYQFKPSLADAEDEMEEKFLKAAYGTIEIERNADGKWQVAHYHIGLDKPFKPNFFVKVKSFRAEVECEAASNGRMFQAKSVTNVEASAMGKTFQDSETILIENVKFSQSEQ